MFKEMGDWSMAKDYNGAERFNNGSRPLIAETSFADIVISGIPGKTGVMIGVYPYNGTSFYEGESATKESAEQTGADIAGYINTNGDGGIFINGSFGDFFSRLSITNVHTDEIADNLPDSSEYDAAESYEDEEQDDEI